MIRARLFSIAIALIVVLVAGIAGAYFWFDAAVQKPGPLRESANVVIEDGDGLSVVARRLTSAGVISNGWMFELEARRRSQTRALKPGEYEFDAGISISDALEAIVNRDVVIHFVTIPEGIVSTDVIGILNGIGRLSGEANIQIRDGEILPETYGYELGDERNEIIRRMKAAQGEVLDELWEERVDGLPINTPEEAVVLASIVEKETGISAERRRVAAVFINRLKRGMKLQSDPTVIYGLAPESGALGRALSRADLAKPTPYNTYVIDGLPPGPICHPGREAIAAVLNPLETDELYFVADGSGGHAFARTLREHNQNVANWRRIQRANAQR